MMEVNLRKYQKERDESLLVKWLGDEELMKGWGMPPFWPEVAKEWPTEDEKIVLMVEVDGETVGLVKFFDWDEEVKSVEVGVLIDPDWQRKGVGTSAVQMALKHAFNELGAEVVRWSVREDNVASLGMVAKFGAREVGFNERKKQRLFELVKEEVEV